MIKVNTSHIGPEGVTLEGEEESSSLEMCDIRTGAAVGFIFYKLQCQMAGRDLLVTGSVKLAVKAQCARCLRKLDKVVEAINVCHHFEGVSDREIDITPEIREDVLMAMPFTFLCDDDCKGLCMRCGANLNIESCKCKPEKKGPSAWDSLNSLKLK